MGYAWNIGGINYCFQKEWTSTHFLILPGPEFLPEKWIYKCVSQSHMTFSETL